jgi:hypothetical protein
MNRYLQEQATLYLTALRRKQEIEAEASAEVIEAQAAAAQPPAADLLSRLQRLTQHLAQRQAVPRKQRTV